MTTEPATQPATGDRERAIAELLPVLAGLDQLAADVERDMAAGRPPEQARLAEYTIYGDHVRHLAASHGLTSQELEAAEAEHCGDGEEGFAARGWAHAQHPQDWAPALADTRGFEERSLATAQDQIANLTIDPEEITL